jgi:hypothetical protein
VVYRLPAAAVESHSTRFRGQLAVMGSWRELIAQAVDDRVRVRMVTEVR